MKFESIEEMVAAAAGGIRPPERLNVAEAAEKYRYLNNPGSYVGYWDNTFAPYLVEPQEVLTSHEHTGMIFAGPARTGKSDMFFNWITYTAKCDPADMMAVHMTMNVARDWSQKDLRRAFRHSKELGKQVAPGRHNQSTHDIRFLSGMHLLVKWPTITELSGKTVGRNWLADYDRMPGDVDGEGNAYDLTAKRAETFRRNGMTVAESSPGFEITDLKWQRKKGSHEAPPTKGILSLYNRGDRRLWYWRCPHCADPFEPDFNLLIIPDSSDHVEAAEATVMACPHCGGVIWHDGKDGVPGKHELNQTALGNARWVKEGELWLPRKHGDSNVKGTVEGKGYRSDLATFWLKGPAANFADWRGIVLKWLKANDEYERTGSESSLKVTVNTDQGLPYKPKSSQEGRLAEDVKAMSTDLGVKVVPQGVRFLVATVDVQKWSFEVQVQGFSPADKGYEITVIDRFSIEKSRRLDDDKHPHRLQPATYLEDWDILIDQVMLKTYPLGDGSGRHMSIRRTGCDSGGAADKKNDSSVTKNAYDFYRRLRNAQFEEDADIPSGLHNRFQLLKGDPQTKSGWRVRITYPDSERNDRHANARGEIPILLINTNAMKDQINVMLDRKTAGSGKINFPDWLPDDFWKEMVAEERTDKGWKRVSTHNEAFDLVTYSASLALYRPINIETLDWEDPPTWAAEWEENSLVFSPAKDETPLTTDTRPKFTLEELGSELA